MIALAVLLFVAGILLAIVLSALLPFAIVAAVLWVAYRIVRALVGGRPAPVANASPLSPEEQHDRSLGWGTGFLVAGLLWLAFRSPLSALLLGLGAAHLTRGLLQQRRESQVGVVR